MKLSARQRKWGKIILVLLCLRIVIGSVLYYVVVVRFKDLVQVAVKTGSNGLYNFDAKDVKFDLLAKSIIVNKAVLFCTDTLHATTHHDLKIPEMYLSITSWQELILHKKLIVDSLSVNLPSLETHAHTINRQERKDVAFHASSVFEMLQQLGTNLEIRSFNIQNGAYTYRDKDDKKPFISNRINLFIKNFSRKSKQTNKLFSSDDLSISLYNQHWILPGSSNEVSFKRLSFSGKNQYFEVDSFRFYKPVAGYKNGFNLSADNFFFNSKRLAAVHQTEELLIDTIICIRPSLSLIPSGIKNTRSDSGAMMSETVRGLFTNINFKYIDVRNGQFSLTENIETDTANVNRVNLKIYNLSINPDKQPHFVTDSVNFNLKKILFYSKDSSHQMSIDEFSFQKNDVILTNAVYGPTAKNRSTKALSFTTPKLRLENISIEDLIKRKLKASQAFLYYPVIKIINKPTAKSDNDSIRKIDALFRGMAGISNLIEVEDFKIINGALDYELTGKAPLKIGMTQMNADILLTQLLVSDSLYDVKQSVQLLQAKTVTVQRPGLRLQLDEFRMSGSDQKNIIKRVQLGLADGSSIIAKNLFWQKLDWNQLANYRAIKVDQLLIEDLFVDLKNPKGNNAGGAPKKLPDMDVKKFGINHISFSSARPQQHLSFTGTGLNIGQLNSEGPFITWQHVSAALRNVDYTNKTTSSGIYKLDIKDDIIRIDRSRFSSVNDGNRKLAEVPMVTIDADMRSSDLSRLHIKSMVVQQPNIDFLSTGAKQESKKTSIKMPLDLVADKLVISNASFKQTTANGDDSSTIKSRMDISLTGLRTSRDRPVWLQYEKATMGLHDVAVVRSNLLVTIPATAITSFNLQATNNKNNQLKLVTGLKFNWYDARLQMNRPDDSTELEAGKLTGDFEDRSFEFEAGSGLKLQSLLEHVNLADGQVYFKNKNSTARADSIRWEAAGTSLFAKNFSFLPIMDEAETFKNAQWQADYMKIAGASLSLHGISYNQLAADSSIQIKRIMLDGISLQTTRDKHIPFRHNSTKRMPGAMIHSVKKRFGVDSVFVSNSNVTVNEITVKTNKKATIPITNLAAVITNFNNKGKGDGLTILASADLLGNSIRNFYYREATGDSLSNFELRANIAPMQLTSFSQVTVPMANVSVAQGQSDTLFTQWYGNVHGAVGSMNFYYNSLRIQLLDKKDPTRKRFYLNLLSRMAGLILHSKNDQPSQIFYMRDKEKFVFNYWVKTLASGVLTSAGVKRNKKYRKEYKKVQSGYSLPVMEKLKP